MDRQNSVLMPFDGQCPICSYFANQVEKGNSSVCTIDARINDVYRKKLAKLDIDLA